MPTKSSTVLKFDCVHRRATSATVSVVADLGDVQSTNSLGRTHRSRLAAPAAVLGSASAAQGSDVDSDSSSVVAVVAKNCSKYNICIESNTNIVSYWSFVEIFTKPGRILPMAHEGMAKD